jgi:Zn-dependent M28 family amino/carboxypeptidase
MAVAGRLTRSIFRVAILLLVALAGMWVAFSRPMWPEREIREESVVVNPSALKQHVEVLCADFFPRDHRHPENLFRAAGYIHRQFKQSGAVVYEHSYEVEGIHYKNIMAEYGPESPSVIIVGAHYDTVTGTPGADDNASGVAGLIELARLLSNAPLSSRVILCAYTLEEPPFFASDLMGSALHARALKDEHVDVKLMICFEMIGYFSDEPGSQQYPLPFLKLYYPSTGNFIGIVDQFFSTQAWRMKRWMRKTSGLPIYSINAPKWLPGVDWSDHRNFWNQGYPAVMITDTAFYRNKSYHLANDTTDRLDYDRMAKVVEGVHSYVLHLASGQ